MKLRFVRPITLGGALLVAGCMDNPSPTDLSPSLLIVDAEHGDDGSHFYFLPPMVPNPGATGVFDATQPAVVEVCELIDEGPDCEETITVFSVDDGTIDVSVEDEHYLALWHAGDFVLELDKLYRISVFVGAQELGYADVEPVANGSGLKNIDTGEVIGLVDNRTLPIKFRIEEGAIDEGITIDATALSAPTFSIGGVGGGSFSTDTPQVLDLAPGVYSVGESSSANTHEFVVTATGVVTEAEPFLDGSGTTLTLVGYDVSIDATVLTAPTYSIGGGVGSEFSTDTVGTFTFLPGVKSIGEKSSADTHAFEVTGTGEVTETVPFLNGTGTTLTVIGYPIEIDAGEMPDGSFFSVGGLGGFLSDDPVSFIFLPGVKSIEDDSENNYEFEVLFGGSLAYDPCLEPSLPT